MRSHTILCDKSPLCPTNPCYVYHLPINTHKVFPLRVKVKNDHWIEEKSYTKLLKSMVKMNLLCTKLEIRKEINAGFAVEPQATKVTESQSI